MKILIIHSYYLQPGGEDAVFRQEIELLKKNNEVQVYFAHNKGGWRGAIQFLMSIWNISVAKKLKRKIREFNPDIIHIHNWNFATGPIIIRTAKAEKKRVVLTVHNYRLLCPSAILLVNNQIFTDSLNTKFPWKAIGHKVYKDSRFLTFWLAFIIWVHKQAGTWALVDKYILLSDFAKNVFLKSSFGIPENKFDVKSNFMEIRQSAIDFDRSKYFLFVGRLSPEKGIEVLLEAFKKSNHSLRIIGDGPMKKEVLSVSAGNKNIQYIGALNKEAVLGEMRRCTALIFPSIWYEGMPMTLIEAFATGTPVIASKLGAMELMVIDKVNGLHFKPGDVGALSDALDFWAKLNFDERIVYQQNSYSTYLTNYTAEKNLAKLMNIYQEGLKLADDIG